MKFSGFPNYKQHDFKDRGPTCLKIISRYYKKVISVQQHRNLSETNRNSSSLLNLSNASEKIGYRSIGAKLTLKALQKGSFTMYFTLES